MLQPDTDETAEGKIAVMVKRAEKDVFDRMCEERTWPQWRMFQEILNHWLANQPKASPRA